jgi:hypothetical protein
MNRPTKIAILHWFPLEQFPPAQNLIDTLSSSKHFDILCCTTRRPSDDKLFKNYGVAIRRTIFPSIDKILSRRIFRFLIYHIVCFFSVLLYRPKVLLYYEPHSALAACFCLFLNRRCRLLIHYHEYREPRHFLDRGNSLARLGHWLEKKWLFRKAEWISHTNHDRIRLFLGDYPQVSPSKMHSLPNLPPRSWIATKEQTPKSSDGTLRLIYIGAISLKDTYLEPLLKWFRNIHSDKVTLDLFINNIDPETKKFLANYCQEGLSIHLGGVPYDHLPNILPKYDIGLILYRCNTINYVYNAPNKLFEYLTCGLSVIYPNQMLGVLPYARSDCSPWVKSIDFENLYKLSIDEINKWNGTARPWNETCETTYKTLIDAILLADNKR